MSDEQPRSLLTLADIGQQKLDAEQPVTTESVLKRIAAEPRPAAPTTKAQKESNQVARRRARVVAFEALYEWDVSGHNAAGAVERRLDMVGDVTIDKDYARSLVTGVEQRTIELDLTIGTAAPAYPIDQMAKVDKAILRLAIYEMVFDNEVPSRAAINEAVELAKSYGADNSAKFVNGVLGAVVERESITSN